MVFGPYYEVNIRYSLKYLGIAIFYEYGNHTKPPWYPQKYLGVP